MKSENSKNLFAAAVAEGIQRANAINDKINRIIEIIDDASDAVNQVHDDVKITSNMASNSHYVKIAAYVNFKEDLASNKVMDVEIFKEENSDIVVTTRRGKTTVSSEEDIIRILSDILSSPTFWSGIAEMRGRG
ncbi:hypothetical protein [Serratia sp. BIGb0163]|uniref:hypothetical protein n=1 Tax=Serratia sp. BIGb0163 TaxID=2940613 RepID=UPI0021675D19|nr:hypothetical protein [Serratia sp. BIGb0163]MCS4264933.1 hypothetical protein [Serratia sp. BIGb0163]